MSEIKLNQEKDSPSSRKLPLVSIIIINYNYEKFLPRAIDSALHQTYPLKQIVVVDDGSTDNSRTIINRYRNQVTPVFQENRGVTGATNTGFFACQGEILFFLDADDVYFPYKVEEMVKYYLHVIPQEPDVMIFHHLEMVTEKGMVLGHTNNKGLHTVDGKRKNGPFEKLSDPEAAYRHIQKWGFLPFMHSPTSGMSLTKSLARLIFPLPEGRFLAQDRLLLYGSMLLGTVYGSAQSLGSLMIHEESESLMASNRFGSQTERKHITINFVNDILQKINKDRIASLDDSRYATRHYNKSNYKNTGSIKGLLKLVYKVPARYFCWETMWFSIKTVWLCLKIVFCIKKGFHLNKKVKLLQKAKKCR